MSTRTQIGLTADGYKKVDERICAIERLAYDGIFAIKDIHSRFQEIVGEAKKLRQALREELCVVGIDIDYPAGGDAA